jgi:hypothetical protein
VRSFWDLNLLGEIPAKHRAGQVATEVYVHCLISHAFSLVKHRLAISAAVLAARRSSAMLGDAQAYGKVRTDQLRAPMGLGPAPRQVSRPARWCRAEG